MDELRKKAEAASQPPPQRIGLSGKLLPSTNQFTTG